MIILRKIFSKSKKEESIDKDKAIAVGGGLYVGGTAVNLGLNKHLKKKMEEEVSPEGKAHYEKMAKELKAKKVPVKGIGQFAYDWNNDIVYTNGKPNATFTSHEIGHRHYTKDKAKTIGDKVGKAAHKYYKATGGMHNFLTLSPVAGIAAGIHSGKKKYEKEKKGEKESKWNRHKGWAIPLAISAPALLSEGLASKHGLKILKKSGATKKFLNKSKKDFAKAWGTYGSVTAANAGMGELSRALSYKYHKDNDYESGKKKNKKKED